ncbi:hypothetical protein N7454_002928 [Penicillium verhagenii]|nr:hypothetical protein N7454_002928 [Penicillium verhagenii]
MSVGRVLSLRRSLTRTATESGKTGRELRDCLQLGSLAPIVSSYIDQYSVTWDVTKSRRHSNPAAALMAHEALCQQRILNITFWDSLESIMGNYKHFALMVSRLKDCKDSRCAWDSTGAMGISRMPRGKPPVAYAGGILWFYMIGSYVLLGDGISEYVPWMLGHSRAFDHLPHQCNTQYRIYKDAVYSRSFQFPLA